MQSVSLSDQRASGQRGPDRRCTLAAIERENLGSSGAPDYVQVSHGQYDGCHLGIAH